MLQKKRSSQERRWMKSYPAMQCSPILLDYCVVYFQYPTDSKYWSVYLIFKFNVNSGGAAMWILLYFQQMQFENKALTKW